MALETEARFLSLLIAQAPTDAFTEAVQEAIDAGAAQDTVTELRIAAERAAALRATIERLRRRERELVALYESANDLSGLRDVELVLQAIVRRGRRLLGADVSYLTLIDEEAGVVYQRVTDGVVTSGFKELQLPIGAGLGGLVAMHNEPLFTRNITADDRFVQPPVIVEKTTTEGLVALLGVPLSVGDRVRGVLYAGNRDERTFNQDDVALLASLGSHAAIALENARLFEEAQEALVKLDEAHAEVRRRSKELERLASVDKRLLDMLLADGDLGSFARLLANMTGSSIAILNEDGQDLAGVTVDEPDERATLEVPIMVGTQPLGTIVANQPADAPERDSAVLERAALVTAVALLHQRSMAEAEQRVRRELVSDLISGTHDPEHLRLRAQVLGVNLDRPYCAVIAATAERDLAGWARACVSRFGGVSGRDRERTVLLLPADDAGQIANAVRVELGSARGDVTVAAAGPAQWPQALASVAQDAHNTIDALLSMGRQGATATPDDLGFFSFLLGGAKRADVDRFLASTLGPLIEYDQRHRTQLVDTLDGYFQSARNITRSAYALHIHPNTLYQRLERISALLGEGWDDPDRVLHVHVALSLRRIAGM